MESSNLSSIIQQTAAVIVRLIGLSVMLVGLWIGLKVILEAWALYDSPDRIERFAVYVERGSNIDKIFSATVERISTEMEADNAGSENPAPADRGGLRLSYFAAWFIAMMLLLIIGSLAMYAISTGGRLVLYDSTVKQFSRQVVREFARFKRSA